MCTIAETFDCYIVKVFAMTCPEGESCMHNMSHHMVTIATMSLLCYYYVTIYVKYHNVTVFVWSYDVDLMMLAARGVTHLREYK